MTQKTLSHLVIAVVLAGYAVAGLRATDPVVESALSLPPPRNATEAAPAGGFIFAALPLASERFAASCAGLKVAPAPIVCLAS
jgi:hypothetical protein